MKRCLLLLPLLALAPAASRAASSGPLAVEILVDGTPLREIAARGSTYIEALHGRPYSVRLTNESSVRLAVALSVDGRNTIDSRITGVAEARKWVLGPWESVVIDGWQTSSSEAHRFTFTSEPRSYAAWLGDASRAGVIEAVAFRERVPVVAVAQPWRGSWGCCGGDELRERSMDGPAPSAKDDESSAMPAPPSAPAMREAGGAGGAPEAKAESRAAGSMDASALQSAPSLAQRAESHEESAATGFGGRVSHEVVEVSLETESTPSSDVRIRYEYHDALVRLGVLPLPAPPPDPLWRREHAQGFSGFCPTR